jgi:hypothetical protein
MFSEIEIEKEDSETSGLDTTTIFNAKETPEAASQLASGFFF